MIDISAEATFSLSQFLIPQHYTEDVESVLIPHGLIMDRVEKLAHDIASGCRNPVVACCVLKGASVFFADLMSSLKKLKNAENKSIPLSFEFIKVKSYLNESSTGDVKISLTEEDLKSFRGKDLLIVEDIIDTGATMVALVERLKKYEPASIKVVSLLVKKTSRSNNYKPDFAGFAIPGAFVVGYALDYNEVFRDLDHICVISEVGKKKSLTLMQSAARQVVSACKEGTVLKGINILAGKSDPVAMADAAYPAWLWGLLDRPKMGQRQWTVEEQLTPQFQRLRNREKIRSNALAKMK